MIMIFSGLPASGKTTAALQWVSEDPNHRRRINFDDLRIQLYGCKGPSYFKGKDIRHREAMVKAEAIEQATAWLRLNPILHSIVIDNCNLTERARGPWVELGCRMGIPVEQHDIDTPVAECVRRDRLRPGDDRVGQAVIDRMALTCGWIDWGDKEIYPLQKFCVVDIDGTLSDPTHRLYHIKPRLRSDGIGFDTRQRWDLFHAEVDKDPPKPVIVDLVKLLAGHYHILIVSGRSPEHGCGIKTEDWLREHLGGREDIGRPDIDVYQHVFMRQAGDYQPDFQHKQAILDLLPKQQIALVIDDRNQCCEMWRRNDLTVLQCAEGKF